MKKEYLIGLLGFITIFTPLANSLLNANLKLVNSTYSNNQIENESIINEQNNITTLNNDLLKTPTNYYIEQISMGKNHSSAVLNYENSDHLYTWGANDQGQLGVGNQNSPYNTPQEVTFFNDMGNIEIEQIAMGGNYSAAVVNDESKDSLYTWGANDQGQLGLGNNQNYNTPQEVTFFNDMGDIEIEQISLGNKHSAAVVNDGTGDSLYTWGSNTKGQLGLGDNRNRNIPNNVTELSSKGNIQEISLGENYSAAIVDNDLYTWGYNSDGQLGVGDNRNRNTPKLNIFLNKKGNVEQISMGKYHSAGVVDNKLYTWGLNNEGQLGTGKSPNDQWDTTDKFYRYNTPQPVIDLPSGTIQEISMGGYHSSVVIDNKLYSWGDNSTGQLGIGITLENYNKPQEVTNLSSDIKQISMGELFSAAIINGALYTWGFNLQGQLGLGTTTYSENDPQQVNFYNSNPNPDPWNPSNNITSTWWFYLLITITIILVISSIIGLIIKSNKNK